MPVSSPSISTDPAPRRISQVFPEASRPWMLRSFAAVLRALRNTPSPSKLPALPNESFDARTISVPVDDVEESGSGYKIFIDGIWKIAVFDMDLQVWRLGNEAGVPMWRTGPDRWCKGSFEAFQKAKLDGLPASEETDEIRLNLLPAVPLARETKPIPKDIHYIWGGGAMPEHLASNILANAEKSRGYRSIVHADVDDDVFEVLRYRLSGIEVRNLRSEPLFHAFSKTTSLDIYEYFRSEKACNYAAAADVLRYWLLKHQGGVYMDVDDVIRCDVSGETLNARDDDLLLNCKVSHSLTRLEGYGSSTLASLPGNSFLERVMNEMQKRFEESKDFFDSGRPYRQPGLMPDKPYRDYMTKIFEVTGPKMLNDVLKSEKPEVHALDSEAPHGIVGGYTQKLRVAIDYYVPFERRFPVRIGSENSASRPS